MIRVLVAEDHAASLDLMRVLLEAAGHRALLASDGRQALELARRERPDLVVCDIQMPELDGFQVAAALKADPELRRIPLIAVTASSMAGDRERVLGAGFDGYCSKPVDPETFVAELERHLPPARRRGGS